MRVLIVGGGGREHALGWSLARSPHRPDLYFAPGNAGTLRLGANLPVQASDIDGLVSLVRERRFDLTVVGPEQPLVDGLADRLRAEGYPVVGPRAAAARLEGSKEFAKAFMQRHGIPTATHRSFASSNTAEALAYLRKHPLPLVVKADGLAAGKGVVICESHDQAQEAVVSMLKGDAFGIAGHTVVVEDYLEGEEASVFALTDGHSYELFVSAQDHKRIGEGDTGPNTGGMGAYAPAPVASSGVIASVRQQIIEPTLRGMREEGHPYSGFLYCGLMIRDGLPKVVEFNCRMGDPEAQVVLPMLASDLLESLVAVAEGKLARHPLAMASGAAASVVLASEGYPGSYEKGRPITGLDTVEQEENVVVFHAGTAEKNGTVVTSGGRVLAVTGLGETLQKALDAAYQGVARISFDGKTFRRDIGKKGLRHYAAP